jgi:hypothetical protein
MQVTDTHPAGCDASGRASTIIGGASPSGASITEVSIV